MRQGCQKLAYILQVLDELLDSEQLDLQIKIRYYYALMDLHTTHTHTLSLSLSLSFLKSYQVMDRNC
jgi:hypothetical protein